MCQEEKKKKLRKIEKRIKEKTKQTRTYTNTYRHIQKDMNTHKHTHTHSQTHTDIHIYTDRNAHTNKHAQRRTNKTQDIGQQWSQHVSDGPWPIDGPCLLQGTVRVQPGHPLIRDSPHWCLWLALSEDIFGLPDKLLTLAEINQGQGKTTPEIGQTLIKGYNPGRREGISQSLGGGFGWGRAWSDPFTYLEAFHVVVCLTSYIEIRLPPRPQAAGSSGSPWHARGRHPDTSVGGTLTPDWTLFWHSSESYMDTSWLVEQDPKDPTKDTKYC